jgi:glyoxylase-like metal-dependent hydrolase (beta-lactamase superfamily II)
MRNYIIYPIPLASYVGEFGFMTYLENYGKSILRPFLIWVIKGADFSIVVDTAIEAEDYKKYNNKTVKKYMSFEQALKKVGMAPTSVDLIIQTHLHFDHCHNTKKCLNAQVFVQEEEMKFAENPGYFESIYAKECLQEAHFKLVKGNYTIIDGIDVIHVPGHTPGCQAVAVQTKIGRAVISGFCSINENFFPKRDAYKNSVWGQLPFLLPGILTDSKKASKSIMKIKRVADIILPLHEPSLLKLGSIP